MIKFIVYWLLDVINYFVKVGIVYNDIKFGNVVFDCVSGEFVVIDLGLYFCLGE